MSETQVHVRLEILTPSGARQPVHLTHGRVAPWPLEVQFYDGSREHYGEWTLWHNVVKLREDLEADGKRLLCVASRRNTVVSGMLLDILGGLVVYGVYLGQAARREDQVSLFLPVAPEEVGTVAEQQVFKEQWLQSLRKQNGN